MLNIIIKKENRTFRGCFFFVIGLEDEVAFKPLKKWENPRNVWFSSHFLTRKLENFVILTMNCIELILIFFVTNNHKPLRDCT